MDVQSVVVTGIGLMSPLGAGRDIGWKKLLDGVSGVRAGAAVCPLSGSREPRAVQLALAAAEEAAREAGLPAGPRLGERWGCSVSASKPIVSEGLRWLPPEEVPFAVARRFGVCGPVLNVSSACATGLHSVMTAAGWIREGRCDAVLAGSAESSLHPLYLAGFSQMGVLSTRGTVRPFDRDRDGFVVGEGAAVFVLEREEPALRRGAEIYGRIAGWDFSCDASHAVRFNSGGDRIAASLARALGRAGVSPRNVDYLNAHGTATLMNDELEVRALKAVFGGASVPPVSSTKGATGHLLGATGAVELAFCLLALKTGRLPPTVNLSHPIAREFDFVPNKGRPARLSTAVSLSFGFGGAIGAMVVQNPC
ncbi:MAG TPA: beta-ketoacyl-[acyl-carrier-protein] synthase family protein [Elusimicrobiota bacterium]|nr:beta-ketoacyl-[acyl-carrier-protein] synthase family protein [Elusimicrobiota bacterium]